MILGYIAHYFETTKHKCWVMVYTLKYCWNCEFNWQLIKRALKHDLSKFSFAESQGFSKVIFKLKKLKYGTVEYKKNLDVIHPSIQHHYKLNRHHAEYHKNGYTDMIELDKLEMIVDWISACRRHKDSNIFKSIEINQKRFNYDNKEKSKLELMVIKVRGIV